MALGVQTDCSTPALVNFGSEKLKETYLVPAIAGDMVTSIAVSEPGGGSDVGNIGTNAVRKGDDLVINGTKMWITSGMQSDWACLLANTEKEGGKWFNKSLVIVPMDSKGITKTKIDKMGMHASDTAILNFDNVHVPADHIIGDPGMGFVYQEWSGNKKLIIKCIMLDEAVPGGENGCSLRFTGALHSDTRGDHRLLQAKKSLRSASTQQPVLVIQTSRALH